MLRPRGNSAACMPTGTEWSRTICAPSTIFPRWPIPMPMRRQVLGPRGSPPKPFLPSPGFYLTGIPNSNVKPDPTPAYEMFSYAASYFGDPDAQYRLGRTYLDGQGVGKDTKQGIR